jgi:hypothetical protein
VLAIRNGLEPRPDHYERIYWDFVAAGRPPRSGTRAVPLQQLMREYHREKARIMQPIDEFLVMVDRPPPRR